MKKSIKNALKTLTIIPATLPIAIAASCGRTIVIKEKEDPAIQKWMDEKSFAFSKGDLIDSQTKELSKSFLDKITKFHEEIEKDLLKEFKDKTEGEVIQPIIYDFSKSKLTSFPQKIFKLFKQDKGIFKFHIELKLNNNELTSFDFANLPKNVEKLDLSYNKFSGKVPLKEIGCTQQGVYINLNNNNYTTYDKEYLKNLKDFNHGITIVKDKKSLMYGYRPVNISDVVIKPNMTDSEKTKHSISFPKVFPNKEMSEIELLTFINFTEIKSFTRVLLVDNKIKW
ncbi:MAG: hypothetical protein HRT98_02390 [Mycoplasmatales bacterium]|nr:hypothetical protein [Mycoplasmatales bacterium]